MNKSVFQKKTGLSPVCCQIAPLKAMIWNCRYSTGQSEYMFVSLKASEKLAIQELYDQFWRVRSLEAIHRDWNKCVVCKSSKGLSVDHIKNRSQGGTDEMSNLQTLCVRCHDDKTNLKGKWAPQ